MIQAKQIFEEAPRKLVHLSGLLLLPFLFRFSLFVVWGLAAASVFYLIVELLRIRRKEIRFVSQWVHACKRASEMKTISWAAPLLAVGIMLSISFFIYPATACGLIHACLADTAAALVGRRWGETKIFYSSHKSYLGSAAYFTTALLATLFYVPFWIALPLAVIGMVLESFPIRDWDNFLIPLGVSFSASLLLWP
ncbi:MAG: hypothetical protein Q7S98_00690 [Deltaproteobacteria bacterium]|nr:hypothetical protein [Deltaproteobacteria bacterium]